LVTAANVVLCEEKAGTLGLTLEARIDRDDLRVLKSAPKELAFAAIRELSATIAASVTDRAIAPLARPWPDTGALFDDVGCDRRRWTCQPVNDLPWAPITRPGTPSPKRCTTSLCSLPTKPVTYGTGKKMALMPKYCLVPIDLYQAACNLFVARGTPDTPDAVYYGKVIPICVPEWTDATDHAAVADPALLPGIMVGERFGLMPEIFVAGNETDPAVFMNDESRIKVRHFAAVGVADFRPLPREQRSLNLSGQGKDQHPARQESERT
jgi:hypothetical protein